MKWTSSRSEAFVTDAQGRDHVTKIELALDKDGMFLAFRTETLANLGAYLRLFATVTPDLPARAGGGRAVPDAARLREREGGVHQHRAGRRLSRRRAAGGRPTSSSGWSTRRRARWGSTRWRSGGRNFVRPEEFPYQTPLAVVYDSGNYHATLDKLLEISDYAGFPARRAEAAGRGKLRGFGFSTWVEACGLAPSQLIGALGRARRALRGGDGAGEPDRRHHRLHRHATATARGTRRRFAQIVAERLGIDEGMIEIVHGDTARVPFGMGTYGSRSGAVGGSAIVRATDKVIAKAKKFAAHLMEASEADIEVKDGRFTVAGTDKSLAWTDVTLAAYVPHNYPSRSMEPGLEETAFYDPTNFVYPGRRLWLRGRGRSRRPARSTVVGFWAADDFGVVINPLIVAGQQHGGVAQGIGQALLEHAVYDANGQLSQRVVHGLRHAAGRRPAEHRGRPFLRDAVHPQPARGEGLRRGGRDRLAAGGGERGARRAERRRVQGRRISTCR